MAHARRLMAVAALALIRVASAAGPCEEGRGQTGLTLAVAPAGGLAVAALDPDTPAAASGLALGDAVVQVNGALPRSCGEYARAVREARQDHKAVLILVRRATGEVPLALAASTWERTVVATAPPPPLEAPSVRTIVSKPPPPPLPPETHVSLEQVTRGFSGLEAAERPSGRLVTYQRDLLRLHRQIETLASRGSAPPGVLEGLRTVLGYYDAAAVAWESEEERRERDRQPRHIPSREQAAAPYFQDSDVAAAVDEFPFLRETVVRDPSPGMIGTESAGLWRPLQARALLWQRGKEELGRLTTWLAAGGH